MPLRRPAAALLGAALGTVLLTAGCTTYPDREVVVEVAEAQPVTAHCPRRAAELPRWDGTAGWVDAGRVPAGFAATTVVGCLLNTTFGDAQTWRYEVTERRHPVDQALLASLRLPDLEATDPQAACPASATTPRYLLLVGADGAAVMPRLPEDPCGNTRPEVLAAVDAVPLLAERTRTFEGPALNS